MVYFAITLKGYKMESKVCTKCGELKELSNFSTREKGGRLLKSRCIECERARSREYKKIQSLTLEGMYKQHSDNAKFRGIEFNISFDDWLKVWEDSGKLSERGRGKDKYCMCRVNDIGAYAVDNVFIDTNKTNLSDGNIGKVMSEHTKNKISDANKGKERPWLKGENNPMHRQDVKDKISMATKGANHYKSIGVITPSGSYSTAREAAEDMGMKKATVEWRARHNKFGFSYKSNLAIA